MRSHFLLLWYLRGLEADFCEFSMRRRDGGGGDVTLANGLSIWARVRNRLETWCGKTARPVARFFREIYVAGSLVE